MNLKEALVSGTGCRVLTEERPPGAPLLEARGDNPS